MRTIIKVEFYRPGESEPERTFHYNLGNQQNAKIARRSIVWALTNGLIVVSGEESVMNADDNADEVLEGG